MRPRVALLVFLLTLDPGPGAAAAPEAARIEVRSVSGALLGELAGLSEGKTSYFALSDVARVVRGTVRVAADGQGVTLSRGGRTIEVRRDSARIVVRGRPMVLAAPARIRDGTWWVTGELVVRAVPALLGGGVEVRVVAAPAAAVAAPVALAHLPPAPAGTSASSGSAEPPAPGAARPASVAAPIRSPGVGSAVALRHRSYPSFTRVVVDGVAPAEPAITANAQELLVALPSAAGPAAPLARSVRDGLIAAVELGETHGQVTLRVAFERPPASRTIFRLEDPPRLVLDFHRAAAAPPGSPPSLPGAAESPSPRGADPPRPEPAPAPATPLSASKGSPPAPAPATPSMAGPPAGAGEDPAGRTPTAPLRAGDVEVRYRSYPAYSRIVLEGASPFEPRLVDSGGALVVPLAGLAGRIAPGRRVVRDGLIAGLEVGNVRGQAALRVTFEHAPAARKVYRLQDPPRLVLDFYRTEVPAPAAAGTALRTVVIDPGHGGHDPGAIGSGGLQEKDITLDIARRLAALVQEELGVKAVLTRTRDQFVALRERMAFANRQKGDLFVSIHVNAAPGATATGTESYFLSSEATDNTARAAAAFENKVIALEPGPRGGSRDLLRSILWDLAQSEFQQESSRLAEALEESLDRALRQQSRGVKQAPFYVLGGAAMPAVLVEIGFLSNPQEEQRLRDEGYRDRIARALTAGLAAYKRHYDQRSGVVVQR
jgi:N-acetylmuramoyl-L-alanine amidase